MNYKFLTIDPGKDRIKVPSTDIDVVDSTYSFESGKLEMTSDGKKEEVSMYVISKGLVNAVNAAIVTGRPLLLKGEPGCGKTKLAKAIAVHLYGNQANKYYFEWFVKSTSNAREGAYTFDHVRRLRDASISVINSNQKEGEKSDQKEDTYLDPSEYITLGPMGKAFKATCKAGEFPILLIDEIDKGNIDFPNDLLLELDEMRFEISELRQSEAFKQDVYFEAKTRPLVIITSNNERSLPPAFLRRCLYYKIPSFKKDQLIEIIEANLETYYKKLGIKDKVKLKTRDQIPGDGQEDQVSTVVKKFLDIRDATASLKTPSTSELLDWVKIILFKMNQVQEDPKKEKLTLSDVIMDEELHNLALKLMD